MIRVLIAAGSNVNVNISGLKDPSTSVLIIIVLTVLAVAPSVPHPDDGFPRMFIVLSLTRNAPGNADGAAQPGLAGLALILSLFIMAPVSCRRSTTSRSSPTSTARSTATQAIDAGEVPLKKWMLEQTKDPELKLFASFSHEQVAKHPADAAADDGRSRPSCSREIEAAFLIGFMIFIPFMIIDLVVSAIMMSMGMYMLPPT